MVPLTSYLIDHLSAEERANLHVDHLVCEEILIDPALRHEIDPHTAHEAALLVAEESIDQRLRSVPAALQSLLLLTPLVTAGMIATCAAIDLLGSTAPPMEGVLVAAMIALSVVAVVREVVATALRGAIHQRAHRLLADAGLDTEGGA